MNKITVLKGVSPLEFFKELNEKLDPSGNRNLPIGNIMGEQYELELKGTRSVEITDNEVGEQASLCISKEDKYAFLSCWYYIKSRINQ